MATFIWSHFLVWLSSAGIPLFTDFLACLIPCTISHARLVLLRFRVRLNEPLLAAEIFAASITSKFSSQSVDLGTLSDAPVHSRFIVTFSSESVANPAPFLALIRCYNGFHVGHS